MLSTITQTVPKATPKAIANTIANFTIPNANANADAVDKAVANASRMAILCTKLSILSLPVYKYLASSTEGNVFTGLKTIELGTVLIDLHPLHIIVGTTEDDMHVITGYSHCWKRIEREAVCNMR